MTAPIFFTLSVLIKYIQKLMILIGYILVRIVFKLGGADNDI